MKRLKTWFWIFVVATIFAQILCAGFIKSKPNMTELDHELQKSSARVVKSLVYGASIPIGRAIIRDNEKTSTKEESAERK